MGLVGRQFPRRHLSGVIDPSGNERTIRVAVFVIDNDFLADARDVDAAEVAPRPGTGYPDPAGVAAIPFAVTIPVEMHLDPAVFVGMDFFSGRTDNDSGLRPAGARAAPSQRPVAFVGRLGLDDDLVAGFFPFPPGLIIVVSGPVVGADDEQFAVLFFPRVVPEGEAVAGQGAAYFAGEGDEILPGLQGFWSRLSLADPVY